MYIAKYVYQEHIKAKQRLFRTVPLHHKNRIQGIYSSLHAQIITILHLLSDSILTAIWEDTIGLLNFVSKSLYMMKMIKPYMIKSRQLAIIQAFRALCKIKFEQLNFWQKVKNNDNIYHVYIKSIFKSWLSNSTNKIN